MTERERDDEVGLGDIVESIMPARNTIAGSEFGISIQELPLKLIFFPGRADMTPPDIDDGFGAGCA